MGRFRDLKFAAISASSSGANEIVAAVTGKEIRVLGYTIVGAGDVTATWRSGASTVLSGAMPLGNKTGIADNSGSTDYWLLESKKGEALNLVLSGATAVTGHLVYFVDFD